MLDGDYVEYSSERKCENAAAKMSNKFGYYQASLAYNVFL